jgi:hypothetical protein
VKHASPKSAQSWKLESFEWQDIGADGTKYSLLEGRRDIPGEGFTYAFFIPAGFWDPVHWHTADARVVVLKGTLYLGYGTEMDHSKLEAFPAGSVVLVPANAKHFDGSDEDTLIVGMAIGPWSTHYGDSSVQASAGTI